MPDQVQRTGQAFFIPSENGRNTIHANALGLKWLIEQYEAEVPGQALIIAPTESTFTDDDAMQAGAILFRHETAASWQANPWAGGPVLLLQPDPETLARVDALDPAGMCVVEGASASTDAWVAARTPTLIPSS